MHSFINRGVELQLIEDACDNLRKSEPFLHTSIIDFYGVEGIGKTRMLEKAVDVCRRNKVRWIKADASQTIAKMSQEIIEQARKYTTQLPTIDKERDALDQSVEITRILLEQEPLVMLLDSVDTTNENQLEQLEMMLGHLIVSNKLFVVLTSRRSVYFENERSVARSLTAFPLQPLDRKSSESYLENSGYPLSPEVRTLIYNWTRGYPLAMNAMIDAIIKDGMNPDNELERKAILIKIVDRVIYKGLLLDVEQSDLRWMQKALSLLSVPRRFNLIMMQKLIETFQLELELANSLAYIVLPRRIAQSTGALSWDLVKAGFSVDAPVRNIFLLQLKVEQPENYCKINAFLARLNLDSAQAVTGSDRIRYQQEYLYHIASSCDDQHLPEILEETVQQIINEDEKSPGLLFQFLQEFSRDQELKEVLGQHFNHALSIIYGKLAHEMYKDAEQEADEENRVRYLRDFFYYTMHDPESSNLSLVLKKQVELLIQKERSSVVQRLCKELFQDKRFKNVLRKHFPALFTQISGSASKEG